MKNKGIIRRIDELGRIVIPIEIRKRLNIYEKDAIEIFVKNNSIILKKYEAKCLFCESTNNLIQFHNKLICCSCIHSLHKH